MMFSYGAIKPVESFNCASCGPWSPHEASKQV